jgi:hypothetical protein
MLVNVAFLSWDDLLALLMQPRFLSLWIVNVYAFVIDALESDAIKATVRLILHEEYQRNIRDVPLASHHELLLRDLLHMGACWEQILNSRGRHCLEVMGSSASVLELLANPDQGGAIAGPNTPKRRLISGFQLLKPSL